MTEAFHCAVHTAFCKLPRATMTTQPPFVEAQLSTRRTHTISSVMVRTARTSLATVVVITNSTNMLQSTMSTPLLPTAN